MLHLLLYLRVSSGCGHNALSLLCWARASLWKQPAWHAHSCTRNNRIAPVGSVPCE
jgi:hypothetical protein